MKILLDACVWGGAAGVLKDAGHDVEAVADWPTDPGDEVILARAFEGSQVVITLDKDFGEFAIVHAAPHHGILRLVSLRAEAQGHAAVAALTKYGVDLGRGAIVTVEPGRVRIRPATATDIL